MHWHGYARRHLGINLIISRRWQLARLGFPAIQHLGVLHRGAQAEQGQQFVGAPVSVPGCQGLARPVGH